MAFHVSSCKTRLATCRAPRCHPPPAPPPRYTSPPTAAPKTAADLMRQAANDDENMEAEMPLVRNNMCIDEQNWSRDSVRVRFVTSSSSLYAKLFAFIGEKLKNQIRKMRFRNLRRNNLRLRMILAPGETALFQRYFWTGRGCWSLL